MKPALLVLEDGTFFPGRVFGHEAEVIGEVACNTGMSGYHELLTDPSSAGRMIALTMNHVGNYGVVEMDRESDRVHARALIIRNSSRVASNYRSTQTLPDFLETHGVVGMTDVDTRALMIHVREHGAQMAMIAPGATVDQVEALAERLRGAERHENTSYQTEVSVEAPKRVFFHDTGDSYHPSVVELVDESIDWPESLASRPELVVVDLGVRYSVLEMLDAAGFRLTLLPFQTSADEILARQPKGVVLSNGPGNPEYMIDTVETVRALIGKVPLFGVALGYQVLGIALGGEGYKLRMGHNGQNIPVRRSDTGRVEITTQSHSFGVRFPAPIEGLELSHHNLNDQSIEGIRYPSAKAMGVQHQPESGVGPSTASPLFEEFRTWAK